ncbi:hypothetical protein SAMN05421848_1533 [Kushneria avicenniae]|uniref:Heat induced stress protein YflT n=1 Tax=Kushneria avicenniae TaxID=402385 RepID=A0A1I1JHD2_9GAMM|nr:hypothetical protein [Kushneria avicenniae]SFC47372.1 hypothetical protein SAMN05421848_1533 [Kushneria avicenniae]
MEEQLVVAVYDTEANADAAMQDLRDAGIPEEAINRHAQTHHDSATAHEAHDKKEKPSIWQRIFGKHDEDTSAYDRNLERGATVIAVRAPSAELDNIESILERHDPIDIDEQHVEGSDGLATGTSMGTGSAPNMPPDTADRDTPPRVRRHTVNRPEDDGTSLRDDPLDPDRR